MNTWAKQLVAAVEKNILGKTREIESVLCCLLAGGHLLIEDVPGVGKTSLVQTLGALLGLKSGRIQFTSDLMPSDILGYWGPNADPAKNNGLHFFEGPIFAQFVLGDELNRASPKTQSACLQVMEEARVTVDGQTIDLPKPFFFVATQNPREVAGTHVLPLSQLDRFMMRIKMGYPTAEAEAKLMQRKSYPTAVDNVTVISGIEQHMAAVENVNVSDQIAAYVVRLLNRSRHLSRQKKMQTAHLGLSPRAGLDWIAASKSRAYLQDRDYVIPEDVQFVGASVINHRLLQQDVSYDAQSQEDRPEERVDHCVAEAEKLIHSVKVL